MRCHCCDAVLEPHEIRYQPDGKSLEPCHSCWQDIDEALQEFGEEDIEELLKEDNS